MIIFKENRNKQQIKERVSRRNSSSKNTLNDSSVKILSQNVTLWHKFVKQCWVSHFSKIWICTWSLTLIILHSNFILVSYWPKFTSQFSMSGTRDISAEYRDLFDGAVKKQKLLDADDVTASRPRKLPKGKSGLQQFGMLIARVFTANLFLHLSLFWMYNTTIIGFGLRLISRITQTSVNVIRLSLRLR